MSNRKQHVSLTLAARRSLELVEEVLVESLLLLTHWTGLDFGFLGWQLLEDLEKGKDHTLYTILTQGLNCDYFHL